MNPKEDSVFKFVPVALVDFRSVMGWLGEGVSCNGAQDCSWLVAAWILIILAFYFARQGREEDDFSGTEKVDPEIHEKMTKRSIGQLADVYQKPHEGIVGDGFLRCADGWFQGLLRVCDH